MCFFSACTQERVLTLPQQKYTSAQQEYIDTITSSLKDLLEPLVGYGKVKVSGSAVFDIQNQQTTVHEIVPNSAVVHQEVVFDTPPSVYERPQQRQVIYAFSTKDTLTTNVMGVLKKQHISVLIDGNAPSKDHGIYQARTTQEMAYYTRLIKNAIGYNADRGDTLEVVNMPFSVGRSSPFITLPNLVLICFIVGLICLVSCLVLFLLYKEKSVSMKGYLPKLTYLQLIQNTIEKNIHLPLTVIKNWIYMPEEKNGDWTGTQKVSILLLALSDKSVRQILTHLNDDEVRKITKTMSSLGLITARQAERVFEQFNQAMHGRTDLIGNQTRVHQILNNTLSKNIPPHTNPDLWADLSTLDSQILAEYLNGVSPEITAFILYHQDTTKAARIIPYLPAQYAAQVLMHLSHIGHVSMSTHYKLEKQAEDAVKNILDRSQLQAGDKKASEILAQLKKPQESDIVSALYQQAPDLAKRITRRLMRFGDIAHWSDDAIRTLLQHTTKQVATDALTGADSIVQQAIQRNVPPEVWNELFAQISTNRIAREVVQSAQDKIVTIAHELLAQGKIHF